MVGTCQDIQQKELTYSTTQPNKLVTIVNNIGDIH